MTEQYDYAAGDEAPLARVMRLRLIALRCGAHPRFIQRLDKQVEFEVAWARAHYKWKEQAELDRRFNLDRLDW